MRENGNINFVLIGARATGKTVYLASLYLNVKSVTSQDAHTIEYLKPLADSLLDGEYPQATAGSLHELKFNYKDEDVTCHIQIDDVDGYFVETMHKKDETTQIQRDTLFYNIKNSEGIIFFFPFEDSFNEESIGNFNYEIDTIISKLRQMYHDRDIIPIPAVIAVAKWDKSPYFKATNESEKAVEYINSNKFLKLAKEKIEHNFPNLMIMPISAIGKDIQNMEPYNLEKPIQYFLKETYAIWEKKIGDLKGDKRALLSFLSKVHFDMKFYKDGQYIKLYDEIEEEFATKLFSKLGDIKEYEEYEIFEKEDKDIISSLKPKNREKIEEIGEKLKSKQTKKKWTKGAMATIFVGVLLFSAGAWYLKSKLMKSESELFSDISVAYDNHNYKEAMEDIAKYQVDFKDTLDIEHKKKVEKMRREIILDYTARVDKIVQNDSLLKQYEELEVLKMETNDFDNGMDITKIENKYNEISDLKDGYQKLLAFSKDDISQLGEICTILNQLSAYKFKEVTSLKSNFEETLIAMSNNLVSETELDDADGIDELLGALTALGINSPETVQKLMDKKNSVQIGASFDELMKSIENINYEDAILKVESNWNENYGDDKAVIIRKMLDRGFNQESEKILKSIPLNITDVDDYNDFYKKIEKLVNLTINTEIQKISYKPISNSDNDLKFKEKMNIFKRYDTALQSGVSDVKITFGANKEDNEPLGFKCDEEDEIILKIEALEYHYDNGYCHDDREMTWSSQQSFKAGERYDVTAIEEDFVDNDEFKFWFELGNNSLIKMVNNEYFEIKVDDYFIGFGNK